MTYVGHVTINPLNGPTFPCSVFSLQEVAGDDPAELFLEEREAQLRQAAEEKRRQQLAVPGIINPHDRPDEMQE